MDLKNKKVLVTGASGFVGGALVTALQIEGANVRVLARRPPGMNAQKVELFIADLEVEQTSLHECLRDVSVIFNCAGELKNASAMYKLHVGGTERLLRAVEREVNRTGQPIHWVQAGSVGSYGPPSHGAADVWVTENTPTDPLGQYEESKTIADQLLMTSARGGGFTLSIVRISNVFGPGMTNRSLFSLIRSVDEGFFFFIGPQGAAANYVHIQNVISGLLLAATNPRAEAEIYNLSDSCSFEHLVDVISAELGRPSPKIRLSYRFALAISALSKITTRFPLTPTRVSAIANRTRYPIDKIIRELGYTPRVSLDEGVRDLVRFYKASGVDASGF